MENLVELEKIAKEARDMAFKYAQDTEMAEFYAKDSRR